MNPLAPIWQPPPPVTAPRTQTLNDDLLEVIMGHVASSQQQEHLLGYYPPEPRGFREARRCFYNLMLASRQLASVARPFLYRHIFISSPRVLISVRFALAHGNPPNAQYVQYVAVAPGILFLLPGNRLREVDNYLAKRLRARGICRVEVNRLQADRHRSLAESLYTAVLAQCHELRGLQCHTTRPSFDKSHCVKELFESLYGRPPPAAAAQLSTYRRLPDPFRQLRKITLQTPVACQTCLLQHGALRLPCLQELSILSPTNYWHMKLLPTGEPRTVDVLGRVAYLNITPGHNSDNPGRTIAVRFETMPQLDTLVVSRVYPRRFDTMPDAATSRSIKSLRVDGPCLLDAQMDQIFGSSRRLEWWGVFSNLVTLQTTTQLLFTSRTELPYHMVPPGDEGVYEISKPLCELPKTLRHIILTEQWARSGERPPDKCPYHSLPFYKIMVGTGTYRIIIEDLLNWILDDTMSRTVQFIPQSEKYYEDQMNIHFIASNMFPGLQWYRRDRDKPAASLRGFWHGFCEMPEELPSISGGDDDDGYDDDGYDDDGYDDDGYDDDGYDDHDDNHDDHDDHDHDHDEALWFSS